MVLETTASYRQAFDNTTILGGDSRDTIDINENSTDSFVNLGSDDDNLTITGKHTNLTRVLLMMIPSTSKKP